MIGNKVNYNSNQKVIMDKIKITQASLYNCEGFMFEDELVYKLSHCFNMGNPMSLAELTLVSPHEIITKKDKDGDRLFSDTEVRKIIKLLGKFNLSLNGMAVCEKEDKKANKTIPCNLDYECFDGDIAHSDTEAKAEQVLEDLQGFEPKH